jgi:hypothetical protein
MSLRIAKRPACLALAAGILIGVPARADHWDVGVDADNGPGTDNALFHGSEQVHDLGALPGAVRDEDWYIAQLHPFSSYQFVVDGMTGNLNLPPASVQLLTANGLVLGEADGVKEERILSLDFRRFSGADTHFIRVRLAACGTGCTTTDTYRARFYDTTYTVPRFNNSGTQATVLLIQNATERTCVVNVIFLDPDGVLLPKGGQTTNLAPYALFVVPGPPGQSGSARIVHECGYGGLSGKAVSVEPATGFTFDTPMVHRPH